MRRGAPLLEMFSARYKVDEKTGCWVWTGQIKDRRSPRDSYGIIRDKLAHRVSYELHVGVIPSGLFVCHKCDNPPCVNPEHLFVGTNRDNIIDAERKGRLHHASGPEFSKTMSLVTTGSRNGNSKLSEDDVRQIARAVSGGEAPKAVAAKHGVTVGMVYHIKHGRNWRHVR